MANNKKNTFNDEIKAILNLPDSKKQEDKKTENNKDLKTYNFNFDTLDEDYPFTPNVGATAGLSDADIIRAMDGLSRSLDYTWLDVAQKLKIEYADLMYRIFGSSILNSFYATVCRIRAQLMVLERDRLLSDSLSRVRTGDMDKFEWSIIQQKLKTLEQDFSKLDRETYGTRSVKTEKKQSTKDTGPKLIVTTSLGNKLWK